MMKHIYFSGSKYWTNTEVSNNVHVVNVRNNNVTDLTSKRELEEMKPVQYILQDTLVTGKRNS
ncbi:MAG: hypothetical protein L6V81_00385 [Clostridium sp.]|nr:MAG: hypothetical protein L6V81_00385 [Clostridium sp.]